jgi:hypothetical protein
MYGDPQPPHPSSGSFGFGRKSTDAVDALVYLILGLVGGGIEEQKVDHV